MGLVRLYDGEEGALHKNTYTAIAQPFHSAALVEWGSGEQLAPPGGTLGSGGLTGLHLTQHIGFLLSSSQLGLLAHHLLPQLSLPIRINSPCHRCLLRMPCW